MLSDYLYPKASIKVLFCICPSCAREEETGQRGHMHYALNRRARYAGETGSHYLQLSVVLFKDTLASLEVNSLHALLIVSLAFIL